MTIGLTLDVGLESAGTFNQSGGTNNAYFLNMAGAVGVTGTYTLSGTGVVNSQRESIGVFGNAIFTQTGGTNNINGDYLTIAAEAASTSTYNLSGGLLNITTNTFGDADCIVGSAGTGVLNVSGDGILTIADTLQIGTPGSAINLSGGTINTAALNFGSPTRFHWTGGKLNLTSSVTWDSAPGGSSTAGAFGAALAHWEQSDTGDRRG